KWSRGYPRALITYDRLLDDWRSALADVAGDLSIAWPKALESAATDIDRFLEPGLRHHRVDKTQWQESVVPPWVADTYAAVVAPGALQSGRVLERVMDFSSRLDNANEIYGGWGRRVVSCTINELRTGFSQAIDYIAERDKELKEKDALIEDLNRGLSEAMNQLGIQDGELRRTIFELGRTGADLGQAQADLRHKEAELVLMRSSRFWRLGQWLQRSWIGGLLRFPAEGTRADMNTEKTDQKTYLGKIDLSVKNNSHTMMYDIIVESAKGGNARILEVGCAGGYFGEVLKKRGFEVWGVEISHHQAAEATQRIDYVYEGSIEAFLESDPAKEASFDFVLFGDVLEHLGNPVEVLRACADILAPEGVVLASIPNVAHMAVRLMLLEGRWDYASYGIMDDTHVRFFTRTSIVEHFSAAGYTVSLMDSVKLPIDAVGIDVDRTLLAAVRPYINDDEQDVFQYVVAARRSPTGAAPNEAPPMPGGGLKILCLLPFADWSVGNIRLRNPLQKWERAYGGKVRIRSIFEYAPEDLVWADVVILQREGSAFVVGLIAAVKRMGKATVLDMDDLLTDVPSFLSVYKHTIKNRKHLEEALRAVDAVTVTTPELAERMSAYTPNVHIVPNCASSSHLPARHYEAKDDPVTLIVASSDTVRVEFIVTSLSRLQSDPDLNVRLIGIGPPGKYLAEQGLEIDVRENMDYEKFKAFLASTDNAVGVIPLDDSEFSACKSAIKYVDYSLA
ncbi:MAG: methyltransferase domain-containing protein, partial [Deltaproteobacteria bacterium]|nr:methyltransferase domain-containing protein [Deltaproteobacteria bacterium]